ncbi:transcriptional regulator [Prevotella aurantiaca]
MLYKIAHLLRDKIPWIWDIIGVLNSLLFGIRYGKRMESIAKVLLKYSTIPIIDKKEDGQTHKFKIEELCKDNVYLLNKMFAEQPKTAFDFFKPHNFDESTLYKLANDKSFLAYIVSTDTKDKERVCIGYFFQRSFFWGKSFRGYMTDYRWQRRGINKLMNLCATEISSLLDLRVFGTIAPENIASLKSAQNANDVKIIETLGNGDFFVEYLPKKN